MDKILTVLLVLSIFLCIFSFPYPSSFYLENLIDWFVSLEDPPAFFSDWNDEADGFLEKIAGGIADIFMILSFPIRFLVWLIPKIIDFISTFILYGVF